MRERWSLSAEPAAVAAAHALAPFLNAAAAHGATRLSKLARAALVSMRLVQRQGSLAAPNLSSLMNPASRLVVAAELLHRLAVATPPTSADLASSALEQLLRAAPLPENPGLPLSDASSATLASAVLVAVAAAGALPAGTRTMRFSFGCSRVTEMGCECTTKRKRSADGCSATFRSDRSSGESRPLSTMRRCKQRGEGARG
jgi:hypothetical protein